MDKIQISIFKSTFLLIIFLLFSLYPISVYSQEDPPVDSSADDVLEEELRYLKAETYVITASRIPENIKKTASSVTVVTDRQIQQMGARNLVDVIETIPGWSSWYSFNGFNMANVRGIVNLSTSDILIMINSHPLNENWSGGASWTYDTLMLDNVKRIEFVRGPGSSLYGANAFAGVINVITKEAGDIDGWELLTRGGSYDTQQYNLLYGKIHKALEIVFNYNYFNTHGYNDHVNEDVLSNSNSIFDRKASLTPGRIRGDDEKYDVSLNLKYKGFTFDGKLVDRERDVPFTNSGVLSNNSSLSFEDYYLNLSYERTLLEGLDFLGKVYRNHNKLDPWQQSWPPGVKASPLPLITLGETIFSGTLKNKRTGFELQTTYTIRDSNTVVAGITYEEMKQYDVRTRGNVLPGIISIPLPRVVYLTGIYDINRPVKRNFKAFFIEDIWDFTDDLRLTAGVRYDDYSDFGDSVNPRIGLSWRFANGYDLKLLYGRAFRAPSFFELYDPGFGNPDLDPEEIDTYQVSLGYEFSSSISSRVTWFRNRIKDAIVITAEPPVPLRQRNRDDMRTEGLEVEMQYDLGRGSYLALNYRYMIFQKRFVEQQIPKHVGNIMLNLRLSKYLNYYASCHIEDGFRRGRRDSRDNISGYGIVNTTLIAKKFLKGYEGLEVRGSVYNLFDKDYVSPQVPFVPDDMPRPGRSFIVEVKYKF